MSKPKYAYIRYKDKVVDYVSIDKIRDLKDPKHCCDFDEKRLYTVLSNKFNKDNREEAWYAHIGRLGESVEELKELEEQKRHSWPNAVLESSEPETDMTESESEVTSKRKIKSNPILKLRQTSTQRKSSKKSATDTRHFNFLQSYARDNVNATDTDDSEAALLLKEKLAKLTDQSPLINEEVSTVIGRKEKSNDMEITKQLKHLSTKIEELHEKINENETRLTEEIQKSITTTINMTDAISELRNELKLSNEKNAELLEKYSALEKLLVERTPLINQCAALGDDKVDIGNGIKCSSHCLQTMPKIKTMALWCTTLLKGVYGDRAKLMRLSPRNEDDPANQFSQTFLERAQVLFRQWVKGKTEIVKPEDVDATVSALPAYLSRRAVDLNGHRGKKRGKNKQLKSPKKTKQNRIEEEINVADLKEAEGEKEDEQNLLASDNVTLSIVPFEAF